ncbi:MAG: hypothetical protein EXQ84_03865 [Rhodospirillaceae bacterium]|nr:hypothetical protein [Rhodospirillaceae bacterium]
MARWILLQDARACDASERVRLRKSRPGEAHSKCSRPARRHRPDHSAAGFKKHAIIREIAELSECLASPDSSRTRREKFGCETRKNADDVRE